MEVVTIEGLLGGAQILREADFREAIAAHDWDQYADEEVLIKGCGAMIVPSWAYMILTSRLIGKCDGVYFGELGNPIEVWTP